MMKTLDEVISALENCCSSKVNCDNCTYTVVNAEGVTICNNDQMEKDALHYLKVYREKNNILEAQRIEYNRGFEQLMAEWSRIKDNPPLTWDELKQMEGKPVWVEGISENEWGIVDCFYVNAFRAEMVTIKMRNDLWHLDRVMQGSTWQAYRKERG